MDLRTALGTLNERAVEHGDKECEKAACVVRNAIESLDLEVRNCHREVSRQRRSLERIFEFANGREPSAIDAILSEVRETLGYNLLNNLSK